MDKRIVCCYSNRNNNVYIENNKNNNEIWDSGIKFIDNIKVKIPFELVLICKKISEKVKNNEFSILVKAYENDDGDIVLTDDYVIPKQTVTHSSVDYDEELIKYKRQGYNVIIHKHPNGMRSFSLNDEEYINSNFDISLLFCDNEFVLCNVNIKIKDDVKLRVSAEIEIVYNNNIVIKDIDNIKVREYTHYKHYKKSRFWNGFYEYY